MESNIEQEIESNIKQEPEEHYWLFLKTPTPTVDPLESLMKKCSVKIRRFVPKWSQVEIFGIHLACKKCDFIAQNENEWRNHNKKCRGKHECKNCGKDFREKNAILYHMKTKPFECTSCKIEIRCHVNWKRHLKEHHQDGFKCDRCDNSYSLLENFRKHYNRHLKRFSCEACNKKFSLKHELKDHQMQHQHGAFAEVEVSLECNQCGMKFRHHSFLAQHKHNFHRFGNLECDLCGKTLNGKQHMIAHLKTHIKKKCQHCGLTIAGSRMPHHVNKVHIKSEQSSSCKHCGERFLSKSNYLRHINAIPTDCPSCQTRFKCSVAWRRHTKEQHAGGFKCSQCKYIGKSLGYFNAHCKRHLRLFACDTCSKRFGSLSEMKVHQMQHNHGAYENIKLSFECHQCGAAFKTSQGLRIHKAHSHQSRKFECDLCGTILRRRNGMIRHLEVHAKKKCKCCGKYFGKGRMAIHNKQKRKAL